MSSVPATATPRCLNASGISVASVVSLRLLLDRAPRLLAHRARLLELDVAVIEPPRPLEQARSVHVQVNLAERLKRPLDLRSLDRCVDLDLALAPHRLAPDLGHHRPLLF